MQNGLYYWYTVCCLEILLISAAPLAYDMQALEECCDTCVVLVALHPVCLYYWTQPPHTLHSTAVVYTDSAFVCASFCSIH